MSEFILNTVLETDFITVKEGKNALLLWFFLFMTKISLCHRPLFLRSQGNQNPRKIEARCDTLSDFVVDLWRSLLLV